jgi:hypothetical protein
MTRKQKQILKTTLAVAVLLSVNLAVTAISSYTLAHLAVDQLNDSNATAPTMALVPIVELVARLASGYAIGMYLSKVWRTTKEQDAEK